jgi:hypothetical protein
LHVLSSFQRTVYASPPANFVVVRGTFQSYDRDPKVSTDFALAKQVFLAAAVLSN